MNTSLLSRRQIIAVAFPYIGAVSVGDAVRSRFSSRRPPVKFAWSQARCVPMHWWAVVWS